MEFLGLPRRVALPRGALSRSDVNRFIANFVAGLEGYSYLEGDVPA